jgi:hypothetical protein
MGLNTLLKLLRLAILDRFKPGSVNWKRSSNNSGRGSASSSEDPKESAAGDPPADKPEKLNEYDTGSDKYAARRFRQFVLYVILPVVLFCGGGWYLTVGRPPDQQTTLLGGKAAALTPTKRATVVYTGDQVLGGRIDANATPQAAGTKFAVAVASATPAVRVRCYARVDAKSPYNDNVLLAEAMIYADAFTRANGGMIWNKTQGWFKLSDLACAPNVADLEIEFIQPAKSATPTGTKAPVVYVPRSPTPLPTWTPLPSTSTPFPGIILFDYFSCHDVRWRVWGASRVYLTVGTDRQGVPGEENGQPVQRDLCQHLGKKIRLDAFLLNGQQIMREGLLQ